MSVDALVSIRGHVLEVGTTEDGACEVVIEDDGGALSRLAVSPEEARRAGGHLYGRVGIELVRGEPRGIDCECPHGDCDSALDGGFCEQTGLPRADRVARGQGRGAD